jgi:P-type Mg2+ transporter
VDKIQFSSRLQAKEPDSERCSELEVAWSTGLETLLENLHSTQSGLTSFEAKQRVKQSGSLRRYRNSPIKLLFKQFTSPIILLLLCSAVLIFSLAYYDSLASCEGFHLFDAPDGCIIVLILLASGFLGFWQEWSASNAVAKLLRMIETRIQVLRDGIETEIPLQEVVPGDVVVLKTGDLIAGDSRLLTSQDLFVDESALTGESFPVEKRIDVLPFPTPLVSRHNMIHMGTHIMSGFGKALVIKTGAQTELGKIASRLKKSAPETDFERGIRQFGQLLIRIVVVITVAVLAVKVGIQQKPLVDAFLVSLALAVGMTPQLLPAVTSVVLAAGAVAMAKKKVIVKQLLAIENLGGMTVLCSDKTGTLTEGLVRFTGAFDIHGQQNAYIERLAFLNAQLQTSFSNPIDVAIRNGVSCGFPVEERIDEIPYDFVRKRLSVRIDSNGHKLIITKGAFQPILSCCTQATVSDNEIVDIESVRSSIDDRFQQLSNDGLRVLGLAVRQCDTKTINKSDEARMTFIGFLVFADPPKADVEDTVERLRSLGVRLKVITGDNRVVAKALARRVGMDKPDIVTGEELRMMSSESLRKRVQDIDIFAEVEPNQKEQIVLALKNAGEVVGYLGDGINDASALHAADVGISVAQAVDVAREAAQVVLLKQDLGVLVEGVREGRRTFANTLKYVYFAIAANFGYMFSLAVAGLFLPFEPLLASQILLVNLLADFPAMALATDNVDAEQMAKPRRWDTRFVLRFMLSFGLASSMFDFLTFATLYTFFRGLIAEQSPSAFATLFQTGWFVESTLTGLMILLVIRTQRPFFYSVPGRLFIAAELLIAVVTLYIPYSPFAAWLGFVTPPPSLIFATIVITILYGIGMETVKWIFYRR